MARKRLEDRGAATQLIVFLVAKVGMRDAIKVATFLIQWGTVARSLGREPTRLEYCVFWKEDQSTYYRDLARLKAVWPEVKTPQVKWEWVEANVSIPAGADPDAAVLSLLLGPVP